MLKIIMTLFIATHNDDEALWGAFTLLRENPVVLIVTDSWIQYNRGETACSANARWQETLKAMETLGCPVIRGGIRDDILNEWHLRNLLEKFHGFNTVYAPAIQGGNNQHDLVGKVCDDLFKEKCKHYTAYTKEETYTKGNIEIKPSEQELALKDKALACYKSQLGNTNKAYFEAVKGKSEWFI